MPPKHRRGHKNATPTASSAPPDRFSNDYFHNADQPCCQILTNFAHQIFPNDFATTTKEESNNDDDKQQSVELLFPTLLRAYLLEEQRQKRARANAIAASSPGKKKRKKKKKKNKAGGASTTAATTTNNDNNNDEESETAVTTAAQDTLNKEEPGGSSSPSSSSSQKKESPQQASAEEESSPPAVTRNENSNNKTKKEQDDLLEAQRREERLRRSRIVVDKFIDSKLAALEDNNAEATTDNENNNNNKKPPVDLQQLHQYIASLKDDDDDDDEQSAVCANLVSSPRGKQQQLVANKKKSAGENPLTLVSTKQVKEAIQAIQCPDCRRDVELVLLPQRGRLQYQQNQLLLLEGVQIETTYDTYQQDDEDKEEQALQYQLMEEGTAPPPANLSRWSFEAQIDSEEAPNASNNNNNKAAAAASFTAQQSSDSPVTGWVLRRPLIAQQATKTEQSTSSWSSGDFEFLVHQYALLLGLPPDEITKASLFKMSDDVVSSIVDSVNSKVYNIEDDFKREAQSLEKSIANFYVGVTNSRGLKVDWQSFPIFKQTDEACDHTLDMLLRILGDVTKSVQYSLTHIGRGVDANVSSTWNAQDSEGKLETDARTSPWKGATLTLDDALAECHWSTTQCSDLWRIFLDGVEKILQRMIAYETDLFALVDRHGAIPDKFISPPTRDLYQAMVEAKFNFVCQTMHAIEKLLNHPTFAGGWVNGSTTNTCTHFVRRVLTEEAFYRVASGTEGCMKHASRQPVEIACEDVLQTIRELTETAHGPSIASIMEIHQQRREKLSRLAARVVDNVSDISATCSIGGITPLQNLRKAMDSLQMVLPSDDGSLEQAESRSAWVSLMSSGLAKAAKNWVEYRLYRSIYEEPDERRALPAMPVTLRHAMCEGLKKTSGLSFAKTSLCNGGNGHSRAACILIGLFFQQMSGRFKEWQAHVAALELLTNIEEDDIMAVETTIAKKKSKKKNKKTNQADEKMKRTAEVEASSPTQLETGAASDQNEGGNKQTPQPVSLDGLSSDDTMQESTASYTRQNTSQPHVTDSVAAVLVDSVQVRESISSPGQENLAEPQPILDEVSPLNHREKPDRAAKRRDDQAALHKAATIRNNTIALGSSQQVHPDALKKPKAENGAKKRQGGKVVAHTKSPMPTEEPVRKDNSEKPLVDEKKSTKIVSETKGQGGGSQFSVDQYNEVALDRLYTAVKVGVHDKSGFQSAESFLVGKMAALTNAGEENITRI